MIKVVIADDEEKICQLICQLVDWEGKEMQVSAVVHNGIDALEAIEKIRPAIVITDIRMPGLGGLEMIQKAKAISAQSEFVIISGYRHFEYAKKAISYGVRDFLLKPIRKSELTDALDRIRKEYLQKKNQLSKEEQNRLSIKNSLDKLRGAFFSDILFRKSKPKEELLPEILNKEYHYHFEQGCFQIVMIKIDSSQEWLQESLSYIQDKFFRTIEIYLEKECFDYESVFRENYCYILLNYEKDKIKEIRRALKGILNELCLQKDILENVDITLGAGLVKEDIKDIYTSLKTAMWAIEQRIILGVNKIIDGEDISLNEMADSTVFYEFNKKMTEGLERLDEDLVKKALRYLKESLKKKESVTGREIMQMSREAINLYLFVMRKNKLPIWDGDIFFQRCTEQIENIGHAEGIYAYVSRTITESYRQVISDKKLEDKRPIREAKRYIEEHYSEVVSLELVGEHVGFNGAYLSSLFKKEAGCTFLEYVTETRMKKAKEILKETTLNISAVCAMVGYSDVKHFTKSFAKYTGLKPNEYRKIYS